MTHHAPSPAPPPGEGPLERGAEELVETVEEVVEHALPPHLRLRAWAQRRRSTHVLWRAAVLLVGVVLIVAGVAMLVLPGPGWAAIILGLVVLASEYAWAHRLLEPVRRWARRAAAAALDPRRRRRNLALLAAAGVVAASAAWWYVARYGFSLDGLTWLWPF